MNGCCVATYWDDIIRSEAVAWCLDDGDCQCFEDYFHCPVLRCCGGWDGWRVRGVGIWDDERVTVYGVLDNWNG